MASLTEVAEYIESVLRLDADTPIQGFDGTNLGESNQQAQTLANRTKWLKEQLAKLNSNLENVATRDYVISVNGLTKEVLITPDSINASPVGHHHDPDAIDTTDAAQFVSADEKKKWNTKQNALESGTDIKTIFGITLLGSGDIVFTADDINPTENRAYVSPDDKSKWDGKQDKLVSGTNIVTLHEKSLLGKDNIVLTADDVNADTKGDAEKAVNAHVLAEDPHVQYLTSDRAKKTFVTIDSGNKSSGYLQLDENGNIPTEVMSLFQAKYVIVDTKEERLAIDHTGDMLICMQLDENTVYYLNALDDPQIEKNWQRGNTTEINKIFSVFNRLGDIKAEAGDYTADLITETDSRKFVHPSDETKWNDKQDKLVDGDNIKTLNSEKLLGSGNIAITPDSIGASPVGHHHDPDAIDTTDDAQFVSIDEKKTWNAKQDALKSGSNIKTINSKDLTGQGNVDLTYSDVGASPAGHHHDPDTIDTTDAAQFVSADEKKTWNAKQDALNKTNLKTVNNESLLSEGNVSITVESIGAAEKVHTHKPSDIETDPDNRFVTDARMKEWDEKQDALVSGSNLSTVFGQSLLRGNNVTLDNVTDLGRSVNEVLAAGDSIAVEYSEETDKITIGIDTEKTALHIYDLTVEGGGTSYYFPGEKNNFDFTAHLFEKNLVAEAETVEVNYDKPNGEIKTTYDLEFDDKGYLPEVEGGAIYPLSEVTSDYEKYITEEIPFPSSDMNSVGFDFGSYGMVQSLTATGTNNVITSVKGNNQEDGYDDWKLFTNRTKTGVLQPKEYWRANAPFVRRQGGYPNIIIRFKEPVTISAIGFQTYSGFATTDGIQSTYVKTYILQYMVNDSAGWTYVDNPAPRTVPALSDTSKQWGIVKFNSSITCTQLKLEVRSVENQNLITAISALQLFNGKGGLIKSAANDYYTIENDTLVKVTPDASMFTKKTFGTNLPIPIAALKDLYPIKICSDVGSTIRIMNYIETKQITIHYPVDILLSWAVLETAAVTEMYNEKDSTIMRIAVTKDGSEFFVFKNGNWVSINILTLSMANARALIDQGMTTAEFSAITSKQWEPMLPAADQYNGLGIAYATLVGSKTDALTPKKMMFSFGEDASWRLVPDYEVEFGLQRDQIVVTPMVGEKSYKFCYKFR